MIQSHVIEVEGTFAGVAVRQGMGYRFVAVDRRVASLNGVVSPSLVDAQRQAAALLTAEEDPL